MLHAFRFYLRQRAPGVVTTLNNILKKRDKPTRIFCDNGSEFAGCVTDLWAHRCGIKLAFLRPGTPTDNAYIESFNGSIRDECLNTHWFESISDATSTIDVWRHDYNESRPHQALG